MKSFTNNPVYIIPFWDSLMHGARTWARENGFTEVSGMPAISGASGSCESFANTLAVEGSENFFGKQAFLVQSGQLYLEYFTQMFGKVFCEIQSFRKEPDVDNRHLVQFTLFEIEHLGTLDVLMDNIEGLTKACIRATLPVVHKHDSKRAEKLTEYLETHPFSRLSYREALEWLDPYFPGLVFGDDLKADHEAKIVELAGGPVLNFHHEEKLKFFSMVNNAEDPAVVNSCDLLLPFSGESAGAAERVTNYDDLLRKLKSGDMYKMMIEQGIKDEEFDWYLDQHKNDKIKTHSGAGIGMARVAQFILGVEDIRDAVPFVINSENLL